VCVAAWQFPLCYHPSLEYQLAGVVQDPSKRVDLLFPGIVKSKPRREAIVAELEAAGLTVKVCACVVFLGVRAPARTCICGTCVMLCCMCDAA
jgi:hypothetical protein